MNQADTALILVSASFAVAVGLGTRYRRRKEQRGELYGLQPRRFHPAPLPREAFLGYVTAMLLMPLLIGSRREALAVQNFAGFSTVFLHISLYYALLLLLLPLLRKHVDARSCASLWMLPGLLYLFVYTGIGVLRPLWVIRVPVRLTKGLAGVWLAGFCAVLLWKIGGHWLYRRTVLAGAEKLRKGREWELLREEMEAVGEEKLELVRSAKVQTPVVIGLLRDETVLVLPERDYSEEELRLLFRHELVHVQREDAWLKMFLVFCTAMVWFNPLLWLSMRRAAEEAELSCDETVLSGAGDAERRRYAELILSTAGDARGFSSCLSASAEGLRYRLRSVVKPAKKIGGILLLSFAAFGLTASCGIVSVAVDSGRLGPRYFSSELTERMTAVRLGNDGQVRTVACRDPEALTAYLAGLELLQDGGERPTEAYMEIVYGTPEGAEADYLVILLQDHTLRVNSRRDGVRSSALYRLYEETDWEWLHGCLDESTSWV